VNRPSQPERVLGLADATSVVIGGIVGVGIFFTPSRVAALVHTGGLALIAWALAGAIVMCGALTCAELGGIHHQSGAQYRILRDAYGPLCAFLYVTCNATAIQAGAIGIIAVVCAANLGVAALGEAPSGPVVIELAVALVVLLSLANAAGVRQGSRIQNATVIARVAVLLAVTFLAALATPVHAAPPAPAAPALAPGSAVVGVLSALVPAFFSYGGWQHALWIAGEVRDARRNVPRAIVGGVLVVVLIYLLVNWAYLRLLGADGVAGSRALAADAVAAVWPAVGRRAVAVAVAVSAFGVLNAQLLSGPRLIHGMASDGLLFPVFGALSRRTGAPVAAIALLGGTALLLLLAAGPGGIDRLLNGVVLIDGIFFALTGAALLVLRRKHPDVDRPVRVPGYPLVPLIFVLGEVGVVAGAYLSPDVRGSVWIGLGWITAAGLLYAVRFRERTS
jgi:APA family basic amino acid/polyamine antiporter